MVDGANEKMIENPLLSVIVPVYNVESYLEECVNSILNQTYQNLEVILIDDGSLDNSGKICDKFKEKDSRVRVIHQVNSGVSVTRNNGIDQARGELIAFVDGDDYIDSTMYEKLITAIGNAPIAFCRFMYEFADKVQYRYENNLLKLCNEPYQYKYFTDDTESTVKDNIFYCGRIYACIWRQLFRTDIIRNNKIRFLQGLKIAEDRIFLLEYLLYCNTSVVVDEYLYHYRMTNESSATKNAFYKYNEKLSTRNETLLVEQVKLANRNTFLNKDERDYFIAKIKLNTISEVVQNEILYNSNYKKQLNSLFGKGFYAIQIKSLSISEIKNVYSDKKKIIYFYLIKFKFWDFLHKYLLGKGKERN